MKFHMNTSVLNYVIEWIFIVISYKRYFVIIKLSCEHHMNKWYYFMDDSCKFYKFMFISWRKPSKVNTNCYNTTLSCKLHTFLMKLSNIKYTWKMHEKCMKFHTNFSQQKVHKLCMKFHVNIMYFPHQAISMKR